MKIITAPEEYKREDGDITVFLAGGITGCRDWQSEVLNEFDNDPCYENIVFFNPRRKEFDINTRSETTKQIQWEFDMLEQCDIFSMYFCGSESDQPICMYELGRNIPRMQVRFPVDWPYRLIISSEENYKRKTDVVIQTGLATKYHMEYTNFGQVTEQAAMKYHILNIKYAYNYLKRHV